MATQEVLSLVTQLGDDVDLLRKPDEWLENHRIGLQQKMSILASELSAVLTAQRAKLRSRTYKIDLQEILDSLDEDGHFPFGHAI